MMHESIALDPLRRRWARCVGAALLGLAVWTSAVPSMGRDAAEPPRDIQGWIARLHEATRNRAYSGTYVVTRGSEIASARIAHVCDGRQQIERIEALSGPARVTWRRDDEVMTLMPERQWAVRDRRELLRLFPGPVKVPGIEVAEFYRAELRGSERLAGFDAWVVEFLPKDALRYGYRIWSEKRTGLALKLQTLDGSAQVLEQVAFTELQIDAPLRLDVLARQMEDTRGYHIERPTFRKTTLQAEGWRLTADVPGFRPVTCWLRGPMSRVGRGRRCSACSPTAWRRYRCFSRLSRARRSTRPRRGRRTCCRGAWRVSSLLPSVKCRRRPSSVFWVCWSAAGKFDSTRPRIGHHGHA
jgi:sigma-E factor negative regulatory protein RseB